MRGFDRETPTKAGNRLFGCILIFIVAMLIVPYLAVRRSLNQPMDFTAVSQSTELAFPGSTRLVKASRRPWQDVEIFAKLTMDRKDVQKFISQPLTEKVTYTDDRMRFEDTGPAANWWNPDEIKDFVAITSARSWMGFRWTHLYILVDTSNQPIANVYIYQVSGNS